MIAERVLFYEGLKNGHRLIQVEFRGVCIQGLKGVDRMKRVMKRVFLGSILMGLWMALSTEALGGGALRSFRDRQGREIRARVLSVDPELKRVKVQLQGGKITTVNISVFSEADQVFVKNWYFVEEAMSSKNFKVKINKKTVKSDRYHKMRNDWQPHHPGIDYDDIAFEITIDNRNRMLLKGIQVESCIFYQSKRKEKTGESELQDLGGSSQGWVTTKSSNYKKNTLEGKVRGSFLPFDLETKKNKQIITESVQLREGTESKYGETKQNKRSYQTREIDEEMEGIIIRISIPLHSGGYARKEYSYPTDLLKKREINWPKARVPKPEANASRKRRHAESNQSSVIATSTLLISN